MICNIAGSIVKCSAKSWFLLYLCNFQTKRLFTNVFSSKSLKCFCNLWFSGQILLYSPARNAPAAAAWFQCHCACLGGGFRQPGYWNYGVLPCQARTQKQAVKGDDQLLEHSVLLHLTECNRRLTPLQSSDCCSCYGMALMLIWQRISFHSCRSNRHWICLNLVHKTFSERNGKGTVLVSTVESYRRRISTLIKTEISLFLF